ncbi:hypothetical protein [Mangrovicoccus ximenensis]|uniref:hypothetical protein n=1 Tax=Mangrovicoccus ximenensis TaxID=1911570 RepID=UPI000D3BCB4B|nr:hypothetical protein [Mangrovicoccus ximenensis]
MTVPAGKRNYRQDIEELISLAAEHEWDALAGLCRRHLEALAEDGGTATHPGYLRWLRESAEQTGIGHRALAPLAARIGDAGTERQAFREAHGDRLSRGTYVSLGCECQPWVILNRWGFRDSLRDLNPLCLGLHRMPGLLDILESDFGLYARPGSISTRPHHASEEPLIVDDGLGVTWNHHRGESWTGGGFARFRTLLDRQAEAFRASSRRPGAVHVMSRWVAFHPERSGAELNRLLKVLAGAGAERPRLVLLDFETDKLSPGIHRLSDEVQVVSRPYPDGYLWPGIHACNSPEGVAWEYSVVSDLAELLA